LLAVYRGRACEAERDVDAVAHEPGAHAAERTGVDQACRRDGVGIRIGRLRDLLLRTAAGRRERIGRYGLLSAGHAAARAFEQRLERGSLLLGVRLLGLERFAPPLELLELERELGALAREIDAALLEHLALLLYRREPLLRGRR